MASKAQKEPSWIGGSTMGQGANEFKTWRLARASKELKYWVKLVPRFHGLDSQCKATLSMHTQLILCPLDITPRVSRTGISITLILKGSTFLLFLLSLCTHIFMPNLLKVWKISLKIRPTVFTMIRAVVRPRGLCSSASELKFATWLDPCCEYVNTCRYF